MKIALLTTDNRGPFGEYEKATPWFGMAPEALLSGFAGMPDVEVHVISCIRQPVKSPEKLADNLWFHSLHVPKIGWVRTGYLGCIGAVRRRLRLIQPDIVHGHGSESEGAICAAFSGFPNVVTLLGIMREMVRITNARPWSFYGVSAMLETISLRRTAGVLANSRFTEGKVRGRTPQTWVVPNAVREMFFERPPAPSDGERIPANESDLGTLNPLTPSLSPSEGERVSEGRVRGRFMRRNGEGPPILLNVGTVCAYKRQNELLDVAEELHADGLKFELRFIGAASPGSAYARQFLERIRARPFLSHQSFLPPSELIKQYDQALAIVHVSAVESFGLVVAEGLARNLKFIGFNSGGVADIVKGVEGAEAFADGDWAGVKSAIRRWIEAGAARPVVAETMRRRYHPVKIAREHLEVYREVLAAQRD